MEDYLLKKCLKYSYSKCEGCINDNALNFGGDGIENISKLPKVIDCNLIVRLCFEMSLMIKKN